MKPSDWNLYFEGPVGSLVEELFEEEVVMEVDFRVKPSQNNGIHKEMPGLEAYRPSLNWLVVSLQMSGQKVS